MKLKLASIVTLALAATAFGQATVHGTIDGPNDIDQFSLTAPSGPLDGYLSLVPTTVPFNVYIGLYSGSSLLAVTGPNEDLHAFGPGGEYRVVVTGQGTGPYSITFPQAIPEPAVGLCLMAGCALARRPRR